MQMKKLFYKPKYTIYAILLLVIVLFSLHAILTPDVMPKDVGIVKNGMSTSCDGFAFSAQMAPDSSGNIQGIIDVYFDDTTKISNDLLLAADYPDWSLKNISLTYSYTLDGNQVTKTASDELVSFDMKSALGGISFRQPFPKNAKDRHLIFSQIASRDSNLIALGYIATGEQLHSCKVTDGVLNTINSWKPLRFGNVQLIKFTFQE